MNMELAVDAPGIVLQWYLEIYDIVKLAMIL
jgi:hypothetical protein